MPTCQFICLNSSTLAKIADVALATRTGQSLSGLPGQAVNVLVVDECQLMTRQIDAKRRAKDVLFTAFTRHMTPVHVKNTWANTLIPADFPFIGIVSRETSTEIRLRQNFELFGNR